MITFLSSFQVIKLLYSCLLVVLSKIEPAYWSSSSIILYWRLLVFFSNCIIFLYSYLIFWFSCIVTNSSGQIYLLSICHLVYSCIRLIIVHLPCTLFFSLYILFILTSYSFIFIMSFSFLVLSSSCILLLTVPIQYRMNVIFQRIYASYNFMLLIIEQRCQSALGKYQLL